MVGFSRDPGSGVDAKVTLELSDYVPTLKEFQSGCAEQSREVLGY